MDNGNTIRAFFSYVRFVDKTDNNRLTKLREKLQSEIRIQTGLQNVGIFQDIQEMRWGDRWQTRIQEAAEGSHFLIPVITPGYFTSDPCQHEYEAFCDAYSATGKAILPIYYVTTDELEERPSHSSMSPPSSRAVQSWIAEIANNQWADWRHLRNPGSEETVHDCLVQMALSFKARLRDLGVVTSANRTRSALPSKSQAGMPRPELPARPASSLTEEVPKRASLDDVRSAPAADTLAPPLPVPTPSAAEPSRESSPDVRRTASLLRSSLTPTDVSNRPPAARSPWLLWAISTVGLASLTAVIALKYGAAAQTTRVPSEPSPLVYVGSGTVIRWLQQHAPHAFSMITVDLSGNTYTGLSVLRDSAEHGWSTESRPFGMIVGASDDDKTIQSELSNEPGNHYYNLFITLEGLYAFVYPKSELNQSFHGCAEAQLSQKCSMDSNPGTSTAGHTPEQGMGEYCIALDMLYNCVLSERPNIIPLLPTEKSGTRHLLVKKLQQLPEFRSAKVDDLNKVLTDASFRWGQYWTELHDEKRKHKEDVAVGVGTYLLAQDKKEMSCDKGDQSKGKSDCMRVRICEKIDNYRRCVPITHPLMLWGKFEGDKRVLPRSECAFIRAVLEESKLAGSIPKDCRAGSAEAHSGVYSFRPLVEAKSAAKP